MGENLFLVMQCFEFVCLSVCMITKERVRVGGSFFDVKKFVILIEKLN